MICFSLLRHHIRPRQSRLLCLVIHYMPIGSDADHSGRAWYSLKVLIFFANLITLVRKN